MLWIALCIMSAATQVNARLCVLNICRMNRDKTKDELAQRDGLRCAVSGERVQSLDELDIDYLTPVSMGGKRELDNLILVKRGINRAVSDDEVNRTRLLLQQLQQRQAELAESEKKAFEREHMYRSQIEAQKDDLENYRLALRREQSERDTLNSIELDEHRKRLIHQETQLTQHLRESEKQFGSRLAALEEERVRLEGGIREKETQLQIAHDEFEKEKARYAQDNVRRVQENATTYVAKAITALEKAAKRYQNSSVYWSIGGVLALGSGIFLAGYFVVVGLTEQQNGSELNWAHVVLFTFKGMVLIALLIALAKYCFIYSQSFMHEALKSTEREHAINFGQFYLESYGASADWTQIKEAFEHWNISPNSSFVRPDAGAFDPKVLDRVAQLVESVGKIRTASESGEKDR